MMMAKPVPLFSTVLSFCMFVCSNGYADKLLLVSMDGFRWDYLNKMDTPNFDKFAAGGVKMDYMNNSFITKTFPNHYTIVTGLYEETHGIVDNSMFDPVFNSSFKMSTTESRWWEEAEPLWCLVKRHNLKSGTYFWPGSEAEIRGLRPDKWFEYSDDPPFEQRIDDVMDWFVHDDINFVTLYFPEPDHTGHLHGPDSPEIVQKIKDMDSTLGYLMRQMEENNLINKVNVIVTSDHGMHSIDVKNKLIGIYDYVNKSQVRIIPSTGATTHILPVEGQTDAIISQLRKHPNLTVYRKEDIPDRFHYRNNRRIMPVFAVADEGWYITKNKAWTSKSTTMKGSHGWDNALMSMKPIFLASGPNFKKNYKAPPINNVDIYPLVCHLLGVPPGPTNGTLDHVIDFIEDSRATYTPSSANCVNYSLILSVILLCRP